MYSGRFVLDDARTVAINSVGQLHVIKAALYKAPDRATLGNLMSRTRPNKDSVSSF